MAQLNLYVPNDLASTLKTEANAARIPLSRYVLSLLSDRESESKWPPNYFDRTCGFLTEDIAEPTDPLPEPLEEMDFPR